jgi:hypothetical protein
MGVKLVSHPKRRTYIEDVREEGAKDNIRTYERASNRRMEKIT